MVSLNFMFFCSLIEELYTKEENYKTIHNFNFGHECIVNFVIKEMSCVYKIKIHRLYLTHLLYINT